MYRFSFNTFLVGMFILICIPGNGQTKVTPKVIFKIDLNDQSLEYDQAKLHDLKAGDFYQIEIVNIHTGLYKITLNKVDSSVSVPLSFPTFASLPIEGLEKAIAGLSNIGSIVEALPMTLPIELDQKRMAFEVMMDKDEDFQKVFSSKFLEYSKTVKAPAPKPEDEAKALLLANKDLLITSKSKLDKLKRKIDKLSLAANVLNLNNQVTSGTPFGTIYPYSEITTKMFELRNSLDSLSESIVSIYKKYRSATEVEAISKVLDGHKDLKTLDAEIRKAYDEFEPAISKVKEPINAENGPKLLNLLVSTYNSSGRQYKSLPIQFTDEQATLDINITPRNENSGLQPFTTKIKFPLDDGERFWGLSSGFYVSYPSNEAYSIKTTINSDTTYSLSKEKPGKLEIGFNTMLRTGLKISKNKNAFWQFGIGPGVSISNKVRPRMLIGTGPCFGEKHKILIDVGLVGGYYDVKSVVYDEGLEYQSAPTNVTVSKLRLGAYFSVNYLFGK